MFRNRRKLEEKITIGIVGAGSGVGTTFLSMALADYFAEYKRKRTALLEAGGQHQLQSLCPREKVFSVGKVSVYPHVHSEEVPQLCNGKQEITILDLGNDYTKVRLDFLRCSRKIVIGSMTPWKKNAYMRLMDQIQQEENYKQWLRSVILFGKKEEIRTIMAKYKVVASTMPYMEQPYPVGKKEMLFFRRLAE